MERNAYINSLAKFTMLTTSAGLAEMKRKNIESIKCLCAVAYTDGNYLGESWIDVSCHCVCTLSRGTSVVDLWDLCFLLIRPVLPGTH